MKKILTLALSLSYVPYALASSNVIELKTLSTLQIGKGEGYSEIIKYNPLTQKAYLTASKKKSIIVINLSKPKNPIIEYELDLTKGAIKSGNITSVATSNKYVAASISSGIAGINGEVQIFDLNGNFIKSFEVGDLPDSLDFSNNGRYIVVANEGEPSNDYTTNSEGSVSIIDLKAGIKNASTTTLKIQGPAPKGTHSPNPRATFSENAEPEYVAITKDNKYAFVSLQEVNAIAKINLETKIIETIHGLGFKDVSTIAHDYSDKDDGINWNKFPVKMMYQPDTISTISINDTNYIISANEGDSQDYKGYSEETRVGKVVLDKVKFPNRDVLQKPTMLGRLKTTTAKGDVDGDGDIDQIYAYGGRSFSIWDDRGTLIFDSGNDFEKIIAQNSPTYFNANGGPKKVDERSDDKGPEPEAITTGTIDNRHYAFIGMERNNAIFTYDITEPSKSKIVSYKAPLKDHNSIESLIFIPADKSPNGKNILIGAYELSGSIVIFEVGKY